MAKMSPGKFLSSGSLDADVLSHSMAHLFPTLGGASPISLNVTKKNCRNNRMIPIKLQVSKFRLVEPKNRMYTLEEKYCLLRKYYVHFEPKGVSALSFASMERVHASLFYYWIYECEKIVAQVNALLRNKKLKQQRM